MHFLALFCRDLSPSGFPWKVGGASSGLLSGASTLAGFSCVSCQHSVGEGDIDSTSGQVSVWWACASVSAVAPEGSEVGDV